MTLRKSMQLWCIVLLGLFYISIQCDARAVNVSNTWTMPQEGLNVFYRFFRDRISWFEADAVCQFHHANLVTVDNSFQFDATRDLLRELDVNDIVWIGLMRPQSSERFMWSNSRPLVVDTGYWAESLPLMDAPLCAVIDPIRDYRWHALRCGGPETASFLCEMPVPSWADACILKDMPNLTMQYMADTASIELIRNCEEEGLIRQTCKGKQDRERVIRELICPRERLETQRINDITNSHFKSLQIINSIRTDNNENNNIELLPSGQANNEPSSELAEQISTEKNTVQRLIEQFNVDELMQADEPKSNVGDKIPGHIPKPVKKASKTGVVPAASINPKKEKAQKTVSRTAAPIDEAKKQQKVALEDMMMGDQPHGEPEMAEHAVDDEESNEIMEPLPHKKKILPQDLRTMPTIIERPTIKHEEERTMKPKEQQLEELDEHVKVATITADTAAVGPTTIVAIHSLATAKPTPTITSSLATTTIKNVDTSSTLVSSSSISTDDEPVSTLTLVALLTTNVVPTTTPVDEQQTTQSPVSATLPSATIGHPMHPQQPRSNIITEETQHAHVKESADSSHFIPPMLLVKSHYVPPPKHEHATFLEHNVQHGNLEKLPTTATTSTTTSPETTSYMETFSSSSSSSSRTDENSLATCADVIEVTSIKNAAGISDISTEGNDEYITLSATEQQNILAVAAVGGTEKNIEKHAKIIEYFRSTAPTDDASKDTTTVDIKTIKSTKSIPMLESNQTDVAYLDKTRTASTTKTATAITTTTATTTTTTTENISKVSVDISTLPTMKYAKLPQTTESETKESPKSTIFETESTATASIENLATTVTEAAPAPAPDKLTKLNNAAVVTVSTTTTTTSSSEQATTEKQEVATTATTEKAEIQKIQTETSGSRDKQETMPLTTAAFAKTTVETPTRTTTTTTLPLPTAGAIDTATDAPTPTRNFLMEETEAPYKPNRRRSLAKPEAVSYFKKILG